MTHVAASSYQAGGAGDLTSYMTKNGAELKGRAGQSMEGRDVQHFIDKSERHEFERDIIISPEDNGLTDKEMGEAVRDSIQDYFGDAESVDYCYAVHRDTDSLHAHVALTGERDDLYMDVDDLLAFREQSAERFEAVGRSVEQEVLRENDLVETETAQEAQSVGQRQRMGQGVG